MISCVHVVVLLRNLIQVYLKVKFLEKYIIRF